MRIAICALSAVLLSGCSWLGGINNVFGGQGGYAHQAQNSGQYGQVNYGARGASNAAQGQYGQNFGGGFPQQPQYGAPTQVTGQYGTHAANAHQAYGSQRARPAMRKPKLRGSLSLGLEKSFSGDLLDYESGVDTGSFSVTDAHSFAFSQNGSSGSPLDGLVVESDLRAFGTSIERPSISFDDVHSTPLRIAGGLEYILTPRTTVFGNVGYSTAEGNEGGAIRVIGSAGGDENPQDRLDFNLGDATGVEYQSYLSNSPSGTSNANVFQENLPISQIAYNFSDLRRFDLEVGARHYFNPILRGNVGRSITPFVGASVGAAHYNDVTFTSQRQDLDLHEALAVQDTSIVYIPQVNGEDAVKLYDDQWVGLGQLNAGLEWQATPSTAIAFETGLKFESARDYVNGASGDSNVSVPFTIRGSYNF